jgi:antagonist of KipI
MRIKITKPGLLSTIQDLGRWRYLSQAVPVSGAMDMLAASVANIAIGNAVNDAVSEFTNASAEFVAETDILIAYSGDGAFLKISERIIAADRPVFIPAGVTITFINNLTGSRTYLAIAGGWDVPVLLGSRSTFIAASLGGLHGRALQAGDVLNSSSNLSAATIKMLNALSGKVLHYPKWSLVREHLLPINKKCIRIVPAHEFTNFTGPSIINFLSSPYTLSRHSNRMGYQLEGAPINLTTKQEMLSTAVTPGTIQVTGSGTLVLLMADCQTTGGYPRIAQVAAIDLPLCGQLKPGDTIFFKEISRQEAEMLYLEREDNLRKLALAVNSWFV